MQMQGMDPWIQGVRGMRHLREWQRHVYMTTCQIASGEAAESEGRSARCSVATQEGVEGREEAQAGALYVNIQANFLALETIKFAGLHFATLRTKESASSTGAAETQVPSLGWEDPLEEGIATHSSIPTWRIPWAEEPGGLQSTGLQSWTRLKRLSMHAALIHVVVQQKLIHHYKAIILQFKNKRRKDIML